MIFTIDLQQVGTFSYSPVAGQSGFLYNALVYCNESLPAGNHTLTIQSGHSGGPASIIMLDRIVYSA